MNKGFLYIIHSKKNGKYYVGSTKDCERRLLQHNSGRTLSTQSGRPWVCVFTQEYKSVVEAKRIEYKLKRQKSRVLIEKIVESGVIKLV